MLSYGKTPGILGVGKTTAPKKAGADGPKPAAKGKGKKATKAEETQKQKAIGFCSHMVRRRGIFGGPQSTATVRSSRKDRSLLDLSSNPVRLSFRRLDYFIADIR